MARPRRERFPDWLDEEVILAEMAARELAERGVTLEAPEVPSLSLRDFVHEFWDVLEPGTPLAWGWALDAMCLHLEAAARRDIMRLIINVPPGTMKPVYSRSMILEKTRGLIELRDIRAGDFVLTHQGRFREVRAVHRQGILPMLKITTGRGKEVQLALDHPVLTARGWVEAQHLTLRDVLAEVHPQESCGTETMALAEARLLGYLVGDGSISKTNTVFTNQDPQAVEDFRACAEALGFQTVLKKRPPSFEGKVRKETFTVSLKAAPGNKGWRSAVQDWRKKHGIHNTSSGTKRIPSMIMAGSREVAEEFLAAYWSCDGLIHDRRDLPRAGREGQLTQAVRIDCTTISEGLARDIQQLLGRLGMSFTLRRKTRALTSSMTRNPDKVGHEYVSWNVGASDQDTCAKFMQTIGPRLRHEKSRRASGLIRTDFDRVLHPDPVREITEIEPGECMCLTVAEDESFTVSGLAVHNSSLCNVFFPAWVWGELDAGERFLAVAFTESLSLRDSMNCRRLVESPEYQERYGERVRLTRDQNSKSRFDTTARGYRLTKPITAATGARGNILLVDDPNNAVEIDSRAHRRTINRAYDQSLSRRGSNPKRYVQIVIMQRLHEEDLTGHLESKGGWVVLRLPEKYEPEYHTVTPIWEDPRRGRGELLFPDFRDEEDYERAALDLGAFGVAGQLQQRPVPEGGGIVKGWWWRYHAPAHLIDRLPPVRVKVVAEDGSVSEIEAPLIPTPTAFDVQLTSWDFAFKDTAASDYVVGQAWGGLGANSFLLDQVRGRFSYVRGKVEFTAFAERWPDAQEHLIEDKANGTATMSDLHESIPGLIPIEPDVSKTARVHAHSGTIQAGNVYLPHPNLAAWVGAEFLPEWAQFPNGAKDDQVDATTQALTRLRAHYRLRQAQKEKPASQPTALSGLSANLGQTKPTLRR